MTKAGAFWEKPDKNGKKFISGQMEINGVIINMLIFKNSFKKEAKHPDYIGYLTDGETEDKEVF